MMIKNNHKLSFYNNHIIVKIFIAVVVMMMISFINITAFGSDRDFEREEKIGQKMANKIEKQYDFVEDPENLERVQQIGEHLKSLSGIEKINYQFNIIERKGPNAFAFPGGFIYITADLFDYIHSDDELAAVIAHEMGHIIHQHSIKQMQDNQKLKLVEIFTILLTGDPALGLLSELTTITILNAYRREYEEEADLTALELLNQSTLYHPVALLTYFERVSSEHILKPARNLGIFQTHPDVSERIKKVKQYLKENGIEINRRLTTNYLVVDGRLEEQEGLLVAKIFINKEEVFCFTGLEEELLNRKMKEVVSKLDQSLRLNLEPYEMILYLSDEEQCTFRIGSEKIVTLSREEVQFQGLTANEVLKLARDKISKLLWHLKLELPIFLLGN